METTMKCDVAIIGGGPAGSTVGTLLKKFNPELDVMIFERERFPRDHVGESLLPLVGRVLNEMGVWDKVEAAGFPVKLGAYFRWGSERDKEPIPFQFLPFGEEYTQTARPGTYTLQRTATAFQVDRSIYDKILLDHARESGCQVFDEAKVVSVGRTGDRVDHLDVAFEGDGRRERVEAKWYVDGSGGESLLRRVMEVPVQSPTALRNIAIWDYWQNAEWATTVGGGGTYVQVLSIDNGWLWFIPLGPTRTSLGFITSAEYYKQSGLDTEAMYVEALAKEPLLTELTRNAKREGSLSATKDWSFVADRLHGENWFLVGDACGFADPILAAGLTLTHTGARRVAYTILEIDCGAPDPEWLKAEYDRNQRKNILNHIRFADYWYSANAHFTELKEYCTQIAADAGLDLEPDAAFRWLGSGGFAEEDSGLPFVGTYSLLAMKMFTSRFAGQAMQWRVFQNNLFDLDLEGAEKSQVALYDNGRVHRLDCYKRGNKVWPINLIYKCVFNALERDREIQLLAERFMFEARKENLLIGFATARACLQALEGLIAEGWVKASYDPKVPMLDVSSD